MSDQMHSESLEARRMLSVAMANFTFRFDHAELDSGSLDIQGTNDADEIFLTCLPGGSTIEVTVNGESFPFPIDKVEDVWIEGGPGDDLISAEGWTGTLAADVMIRGGAGDDTLKAGSSDDVQKRYGDPCIFDLYGEEGADLLVGGSGDDELDGNDYEHYLDLPTSDTLDGGAGDDVLNNDSSDVILASPGNDAMDLLDPDGSYESWQTGARLKDDTIQVVGTNESDQILITQSADLSQITIVINGVAHTFTADGVLWIDVYAGRGDDWINASHFVRPEGMCVWMMGDEGNDTLEAGSAASLEDAIYEYHLYGYDGDDLLIGSNGVDDLFGGIGADHLIGGDGNDILDGGEWCGNPQGDTLDAGAGDDSIWQDSIDSIIPSEGNDTFEILGDDYYLMYEPGVELVDGTIEVYGTIGDDEIDISHSADESMIYIDMNGQRYEFASKKVDSIDVCGQTGDDHITGIAWTLKDVWILFSGDEGNDTLEAGTGDFYLAGDYGDDLLIGGPSNDELEGGGGADVLLGNGGNDLLDGDEWFWEDDVPQRDVLDGGDGDDRIWHDALDSVVTGAGEDKLREYMIEPEEFYEFDEDIVFATGITCIFRIPIVTDPIVWMPVTPPPATQGPNFGSQQSDDEEAETDEVSDELADLLSAEYRN